jgi:hypothetical protein
MTSLCSMSLAQKLIERRASHNELLRLIPMILRSPVDRTGSSAAKVVATTRCRDVCSWHETDMIGLVGDVRSRG